MPRVGFAEYIESARAGDRLLSFPTDTVPALASRPDRAALIYAVKERSETKPLILMGGDADDLWEYVQGSEAEYKLWRTLAAQYWPGALTLVLPASDRLPSAMNPTDASTIGIRIPNRAIARHILRQTGPLATTSINKSGQPALQTLSEIEAQFPQVLTLGDEEVSELETTLLQAEPTLAKPGSASGIPSTVAKWASGRWEILRQGAIELD